MAHVKLPDGREFDIPDSDSALETYYRGEGATIGKQVGDGPTSLPAVFDGEQYVDTTVEEQPAEPLPNGADADLSAPVEVPGTGEPNTGYTVPPNADGTFGPATLGPDGATVELDGQTVALEPDVASGDVPVEHDPAVEADQPASSAGKPSRSTS